MEYRQYLYSIDTWLVDEIKKCKTRDDFIKTMQKYRNDIVEYDSFDEQYYIPLYHIGKELFEFGKCEFEKYCLTHKYESCKKYESKEDSK